ncbi:MAG: phosphoribosylamine--glycine ligase [Bacteroidota bacterium]|jgi:phosphoribosylamine--glycine ligase
MHVLILGSGGREHAFAWKIAQSSLIQNLYVAPGNAGTEQVASNISIDPNDFKAVKKFVLDNQIDMVVVGPEDPLVNGIVDFFKSDKQLNKVGIIGPNAQAAQLEGSKDFAKQFMFRHGIPTAKYQSFQANQLKEGQAYLETLKAPYVLKASGLAAGKGVVILEDLNKAKKELKAMLSDNKFGEAGSTVVIEEFLKGVECSVFILTDGNNYKILPEAKDYKRIGEGDTGLNTGGMGAVSPVPFCTPEFMDKIETQVIIPTMKGLKADQIDYQGFIFFGLIKVGNEPYVIEYNCRMGDPETEVVIPRIKSDLLHLFEGVTTKTLGECDINIDSRSAATVMMVSEGYPENYEKGKEMSGLIDVRESLLFHAGTKKSGQKTITNGGRVIAATSFGSNIFDALDYSYEAAETIQYKGKYFRTDLGEDLKKFFKEK